MTVPAGLEPTPALPKLVPTLARLAPQQLEQLRQLARATRIPQSVLLREAVTDLLRKYSAALGGGEH